MNSQTSLPSEVWRQVPGFEGWYEASDRGNVRSWHCSNRLYVRAAEARVLTARIDGLGHSLVTMFHPVCGALTEAVHHVVLATFVGPRPLRMTSFHINGNRGDNRAENLRWVREPARETRATMVAQIERSRSVRSHADLSPGAVIEIRRLQSEGYKPHEIAATLHVPRSAISKVNGARSWTERNP